MRNELRAVMQRMGDSTSTTIMDSHGNEINGVIRMETILDAKSGDYMTILYLYPIELVYEEEKKEDKPVGFLSQMVETDF